MTGHIRCYCLGSLAIASSQVTLLQCVLLQEFLALLDNTLNKYPPLQPTKAAVDLLVTVGQQQEYLLWHNLMPPPGQPGSLDAFAVSQQQPRSVACT